MVIIKTLRKVSILFEIIQQMKMNVLKTIPAPIVAPTYRDPLYVDVRRVMKWDQMDEIVKVNELQCIIPHLMNLL